MSTVPEFPERVPDEQSEARLVELRREAQRRGQVSALGIRPPGAPFPQASPETGYYGAVHEQRRRFSRQRKSPDNELGRDRLFDVHDAGAHRPGRRGVCGLP